MRALLVSTWIFINLVFFGMCGYMYLLWSHYWINSDSKGRGTTINYDQQIYLYNRGLLNDTFKAYDPIEIKNRTKHSIKSDHGVTIVYRSKPRFPNPQGGDNFEMDTNKYMCVKDDDGDSCEEKVTQFKEKLMIELKRVFLDESNILKKGQENYYNVNYRGPKGNYMEKTPDEIMCEMRKIKISTLRRDDVPNNLIPGFKRCVSRKHLYKNSRFHSCAIIASAGSLKGSNLGTFIDSHNLVLRFNNAPTAGYEKDVGHKTNIRIVNSQVISKQEFNFLNNSLFQNVTILGWDPSNYTSSLEEWLQNPEYPLFTNFVKYRKMFQKSKMYLVDPRSVWRLWDFLQGLSFNRLRRNPPSSGFIGLSLLLSYCDFVDVIEYIPSVRVTKRCHYYDSDENSSCTFGIWHPLAAEKLLTYHLNVVDDKTVFQNGYVKINGYSRLSCK